MSAYEGYFAGKTALVTGGASGIGLALCQELLAAYAAGVVLADVNRENLDRQAQALSKQYPGKVWGHCCDVRQEEQVEDMLAAAVACLGGRLDLLVNNAGKGFGGCFVKAAHSEALEKMGLRVQTMENWQQAFALNFYGALYGCKAAIPRMRQQGGGQILNVISGIAFSPMPYQTMYAATKAALNGLSLALRTEFWDDNIKISSATPGTTATAIWETAPIPDSAQTPQQSAQRILRGLAANERLIMGDDSDLEGSRHCFDPAFAQGQDKYFLRVARARRAGKMAI